MPRRFNCIQMCKPMDALITAAASGMRARMETLDVLANNLANTAAPGFKADREFYNLYISDEAQPNSGLSQLTQPVSERNWIDFSQGSLSPTGNNLDVAISGKGFFAVNSPAGTLYTRDGSFQLSPQGLIQTKEGYSLRRQDSGKPIQVDQSLPVEITPDGIVRQDGQDLAKIDLVDFSNVQTLAKQGRNYFILSNPDLKPTPATEAELQQGKIESANVQPAESAVRLITVMRQFEILQKAMTIGADMNKKALDEVARVA